jgi:hypothetical protein
LSTEQKVERIRESLADKSSLAAREESSFLRQNDYWIVRYHGHAALLKSTRGLHYLAVLLRDPGREFHVRELIARPIDASTLAAVVAAKGRVTDAFDAGLPLLDAITLTLTRQTNRQCQDTLFAAVTKANVTDRVRCIVVPFGISLICVRVPCYVFRSDNTRLKAV